MLVYIITKQVSFRIASQRGTRREIEHDFILCTKAAKQEIFIRPSNVMDGES